MRAALISIVALLAPIWAPLALDILERPSDAVAWARRGDPVHTTIMRWADDLADGIRDENTALTHR
jgi:hypothetical protein